MWFVGKRVWFATHDLSIHYVPCLISCFLVAIYVGLIFCLHCITCCTVCAVCCVLCAVCVCCVLCVCSVFCLCGSLGHLWCVRAACASDASGPLRWRRGSTSNGLSSARSLVMAQWERRCMQRGRGGWSTKRCEDTLWCYMRYEWVRACGVDCMCAGPTGTVCSTL